jgi:tRNA threonylcarbamoyladenosine biosynthesis protein TsaB
MKILAIDTTTFLGSVALVEDDRLVSALQQGTSVTYSERLISGIDHLLQNANWAKDDLDLIAVAVGPGSFTGLRIGMATAKGLAVALGTPLVGVSSLCVMANSADVLDGKVAAILDARRDEVYAAVYQYKDGAYAKTLMDECVLPPDKLCAALKKIKGVKICVGDGARRYRNIFAKKLKGEVAFPHDAKNFPHAGYLATLARERYEEKGADEAEDLAPNYIRISDAEIGFKGRHSKKSKKGRKR